MTNPLSIIGEFKTYIHYMTKSAIEEQQAIATLRRIYRPNNEVSINGKKLPQSKDRLDKKLQDYAAQRRLLDELENTINFIEQEEEKDTEK